MRAPIVLRVERDKQQRWLDRALGVGVVISHLKTLGIHLILGSLGVPYHSWKITHAKHHASTGHMTQDQVFVPQTRSEAGLKPLDPAREDRLGSRVTEEVKRELWEALGDSPIGAVFGSAGYLVSHSIFLSIMDAANDAILQLGGWPSYILWNVSGQTKYPKGTNRQFFCLRKTRTLILIFCRLQSLFAYVCPPSLQPSHDLYSRRTSLACRCLP